VGTLNANKGKERSSKSKLLKTDAVARDFSRIRPS
jgi:hypothetical protein